MGARAHRKTWCRSRTQPPLPFHSSFVPLPTSGQLLPRCCRLFPEDEGYYDSPNEADEDGVEWGLPAASFDGVRAGAGMRTSLFLDDIEEEEGEVGHALEEEEEEEEAHSWTPHDYLREDEGEGVGRLHGFPDEVGEGEGLEVAAEERLAALLAAEGGGRRGTGKALGRPSLRRTRRSGRKRPLKGSGQKRRSSRPRCGSTPQESRPSPR